MNWYSKANLFGLGFAARTIIEAGAIKLSVWETTIATLVAYAVSFLVFGLIMYAMETIERLASDQ